MPSRLFNFTFVDRNVGLDNGAVMDFGKQSASCEKAKQLDMVTYLSGIGYEPVKIRNFDYWYLSPLRDEKTPSFKINQKLNRWYDHGLGKGGNLIDFAILYHHCTVGEFLQKISGNLSFHPPITPPRATPENTKESHLNVLLERPISSYSLCRYLQQRSIPLELAKQYCQEVKFEMKEKEYTALGFKNDSGGYELRHPYFKASSSPKDITTFNNGTSEATVFEGFFDFLSFLATSKNQAQKPTDFLILNSVSFFQKARPFLEQHQEINLYLDRDNTGKNVTCLALGISNKYQDKSSLYASHKDLNEWVMNLNQGKEQKKSFKPKLR